jgi:hypothetical protein
MLKKAPWFVIILAPALMLVPFLPFYIERTMMRSWRVDHAGDVIEWGWKFCTLRAYWSDYSYLSSEQRPAFWLAVNIALAFVYALVITIILDRLIARRKRA